MQKSIHLYQGQDIGSIQTQGNGLPCIFVKHGKTIRHGDDDDSEGESFPKQQGRIDALKRDLEWILTPLRTTQFVNESVRNEKAKRTQPQWVDCIPIKKTEMLVCVTAPSALEPASQRNFVPSIESRLHSRPIGSHLDHCDRCHTTVRWFLWECALVF